MKSLTQYILEKQNVNFGASNPSYNQCVILAGGPASGKGYVKDLKLLLNFKTVDVDEMKKQYIKLQERGKIKDDDYSYDFKKAEDVFRLHMKVKNKGWKTKQRTNFWKSQEVSARKNDLHLPNILWDMVSDDPDDVYEIIRYAKPLGYKITLIWVCANMETAKAANKMRDRTVPDSVLHAGHAGAYKTIEEILRNKYKTITDGIDTAWIVFSAGYKRMLTGWFKDNPVIKIKKDQEGDFDYKYEDNVNKFLTKQMPEDPEWEKKKQAEAERKKHVESARFKESLDDYIYSIVWE